MGWKSFARISVVLVVVFLVVYCVVNDTFAFRQSSAAFIWPILHHRQKEVLLSYETGNNAPQPVSSIVNVTGVELLEQTYGRDIFYFAVTHSSTMNNRLQAAVYTWCSRVHAHTGRRVVWYSNAPHPFVDHVISIDGIDARLNITWRMLAIWRHVALHYKNYAWYARFWDDSYVIPETLELLALQYDSNQPVEIGRMAQSKGRGNSLVRMGTERDVPKRDWPYMDGGAGSLLSAVGLTAFMIDLPLCESWLIHTAPQEITCTYACEDVLLGWCYHNLFQIRFYRALGMYHESPEMLGVLEEDLRAHALIDPEHADENTVPKTFHLVSPQAMFYLDSIWYNSPPVLHPACPAEQNMAGPVRATIQHGNRGPEPDLVFEVPEFPETKVGVASMRKVYDLFLFNDELNTLELRLIELWDVVDFFLLIQHNTTISGRPRKLMYSPDDDRFRKYRSKIRTLDPSDYADDSQYHSLAEREHGQRAQGLALLARMDPPPDSLVLFTDLDEIPSCWTVYSMKHTQQFPTDTFVHLEMDLFYYSLRWKASRSFSNSKAFLYSYLQSTSNWWDLFFLDNVRHWEINNAGWHCSYCMSAEKIQNKLLSFAHAEYAHPPFTDLPYIVRHLTTGQDLFDRAGHDFSLVHAFDNLPAALRLLPERFLPLYLPNISISSDGKGEIVYDPRVFLL